MKTSEKPSKAAMERVTPPSSHHHVAVQGAGPSATPIGPVGPNPQAVSATGVHNAPSPTAGGFAHTNFVNDRFDVFGTLYFLSEKQHDGVRDFLIHRLYALPDEDIEFVLPQLCHLYLVWSTEQGRGLGMFLAKKCAQSLHLAIKITWQLQASQPYVSEKARQRANDLLQTCEMALVNASFDRGSGGYDKQSKARAAAGAGSKSHRSAQSTPAAAAGGAVKSNASGAAALVAPSAAAATGSGTGAPVPPAAVTPRRGSSAGADDSDGTSGVGGDDDSDDDGGVFVPPSDDTPSSSPTHTLQPLHSNGSTGVAGAAAAPSSFERNNSLPPAARSPDFDARKTLLSDAKTPAAAAGGSGGSGGELYKSTSDEDLKGYVVVNTSRNALVRAGGAAPAAAAAGDGKTAPGVGLAKPTHARATSTSALPEPAARPIAAGGSAPPAASDAANVNGNNGVGSAAVTASALSNATGSKPSHSSTLPAALPSSGASSAGAGAGATPLKPIREDSFDGVTDLRIPGFHTRTNDTASASGATPPPKQLPASVTAAAAASASALGQPKLPTAAAVASGAVAPSGSVSARGPAPARASPSSPKGLTPAPGSAVALDERFRRGTREFEQLLAKQLRSEYFNQELVLLSSMSRISEQLTKVARPRRNEHLRAYIRTLDFNTAKGLYLPTGTMSDRHFKILSIPANESVCLNSRDKAPFLMFVEVCYSGKKNSGTDLYKAYKNRVDDYVLSDHPPALPPSKTDEKRRASASATAGATASAAASASTPALAAGTAKSSRSSGSGAGGTAFGSGLKPRNALYIGGSGSPDSPAASPPVSPSAGQAPAGAAGAASAATDSPVPGVRSSAGLLTAPHAGLPRSKSQTLSQSASTAAGASGAAAPSAAGVAASASGSAASTGAGSGTEPAQQPRHHLSTPVMDPPPVTPTSRTSPLLTFAPGGLPPLNTSPSDVVAAAAAGLTSRSPASANAMSLPASALSSPVSGVGASASAPASSASGLPSPAPAAAAVAASKSLLSPTAPPAKSSGGSPSPAALLNGVGVGVGVGAGVVGSSSVGVGGMKQTITKLDLNAGKSVPLLLNPTSPVAVTTPTSRPLPAAGAGAGAGAGAAASGSSSGGAAVTPKPVAHSASANDLAKLNRNNNVKFERAFGELFHNRKKRLRAASPYGRLDNWDLISVIFKGGDDCRQEALAMQLIVLFDKIFRDAKLGLFLQPYTVLVTSPTSGMIQTVPNAVSIDGLKKDTPNFTSLANFFEQYFGPKGSAGFKKAQRNFVESMAAYSLVCYFLQIKDRHNGNILLTSAGHVVHIDFGFMLSNSPGGNINWESCPFKLTAEYVQVMEGEDSDAFNYYKVLIIKGFLEARKYAHIFCLLVAIMMREGKMACFLGGPATLDAFRARFALHLTDDQCVAHAIGLVEDSINNWRTVQYDNYQRITNGIL